MGYGGVDEVKIDDEAGIFWVHREDSNTWNLYEIDKEQNFLDWIDIYDDQIEVSHRENLPEMVESTDEDFSTWEDDPNEDFGSWG